MTGTSVGEMANENHQQEKRSHCCISHEFFDAATKHPDKIAVIHASGWAAKISSDPGYASPPSPGLSLSCTPPVYDGDKCFSFAEVLSSVDSLSSRLRRILDGGGDNDAYLIKPRFRDELYSHVGGRDISFGSDVYMPKVLGIYMPPSVEYIISVLSVMRCGEAFLPLDPSWPRDRILSIISSSNASLVIACGSSFNEVGCQPLERSHWLVESSSSPVLLFSKKEDSSEESDSSSFIWPCKKERCRAFCYLMYTSGSTGKPKGVCGTEQGLLNRFLWMQKVFPVVGEEHLAFKTSIGFVDHLQEFLGAILTSTPLVIPPFTIMRKNMFSILYFLEAYTISRLISVPSMIRAILPTLQSYGLVKLQNSLKLIVLSGEDFPISLWDMLHKLLPDTCILNLYGSTEVSGDCTYFDCRRLPKILKTEKIASVPIGLPISNCEVVIIPDRDNPYEGEICVGGFCLSSGYLHTWTLSQDYVKLHGNSVCDHVTDGCGSRLYFRTGDYGRKLPSGDLVFLGRRDRTIKLNGQRIALEEIERSLELHPSVVEAVVLLSRDQKELASLEAFLVIKKEDGSDDNIIYSIRNWLVERLPSLMIPKYFVLMESMPVSLSGKVDYKALASLRCPRTCARDTLNDNEIEDLMQAIRKAFCDALVVKEVSDDDDFFAMGGDSLAAAHLSHSLGINMRLLYEFSCPSKLCNHLLEKKGFPREGATDNVSLISDLKKESQNGTELIDCNISVDLLGDASNTSPLSLHYEKNISAKRLKVDSVKYEYEKKKDRNIWNSIFANIECSFTRCNKMSYVSTCNSDDASQRHWSVEFPKDRMISMQELWKVHMDSCVDASPLIVFKSSNIYLFIGSHSHKFLCIDAKSGSICWETILEGRIEGSAAIIGDFSRVVVGCYNGKIYLLDFSTGSVCWTFEACGEVKCQPVVDSSWQLIWCGSHDHNLYALDYRSQQCVYKLQCGGSIFGSPVIDEEHDSLYVASTSGRVTAISIREFPFHTLWLLELEVPIFGSLSISPTNRNVICCLVDGQVVSLSPSGSITWRYRTGGPIFAGPSRSYVLPSQALICSRNGSIYSLELETGCRLWEYNIGDPITASTYIDENIRFGSDQLRASDRLVCVCSSSGRVHILRVSPSFCRDPHGRKEDQVQEITKLELPADIFSSPVMIGGRIFVGCRDDYVHCLSLEYFN